jgi:hypothetical protein
VFEGGIGENPASQSSGTQRPERNENNKFIIPCYSFSRINTVAGSCSEYVGGLRIS